MKAKWGLFMTEQKKNTIITSGIAVLAVILAYCFRIVGRGSFYPMLFSYLRSFIYIGLFAAWGLSVRQRIVQKQVCRFMTVTAKANAVLLDAEARQIIESATGLTIHLYDKMFKADQYSASEKYLPDGMVVVAPSGALGSTWYGTTPEEADLLSGQSGASVSIVNTGVAITTELTVHPVNANVYASEIVLPSFERMDAVYCIKAY